MGSALDGVGLLEYLDLDLNPALVFDVQSHRLAYENNAFQDWRKESARESLAFSDPSFLEWLLQFSKTTSSGDFAVGGRTWRTTLLRKRWMMISSHEKQLATKQERDSVPPTPPIIHNLADFRQDSSSLSSRTGRSSSAVSSVSPSVSSGPDSFSTATKPLDWTKYHVSGLSAHIIAVKSFPWESTSIGHIDSWSDVFRSIVLAMNANSEARILLWGPERTMIYNEACAPLFGQKHPLAMGARAEDIWSEAWPHLSGFISRAENEGKAVRMANFPLTMHRHGYDEETFWIANFVPIIGTKGKVVAIRDEFTETTLQVIQDRRRDIVIKTSELLSNINTLEEIWDGFLKGLQRAEDDIPYAGIYVPAEGSHRRPSGATTSGQTSTHFSLHGTIGIELCSATIPEAFDLRQDAEPPSGILNACREAWRTGDVISLSSAEDSLPHEMAISIPERAGGCPVKHVCIVPIPDLRGSNQLAFAVIALTGRRPFNANTNEFIRSLADVLTRSASTIFLPDEQRRVRQRFEEIETALSQKVQASQLEAERVGAQYDRLINRLPVGIFVMNSNEKLLYHNDAFWALTGSTPGQGGSCDRVFNLMHEQDRGHVRKVWKSSIDTKTSVTVEYRVEKEWRSVDVATGMDISGESWVLATIVPELDESGNVDKISGWMLDISDRKYHEKVNLARAEEERAEARFARLAETAPMGMYLLKPDGSPVYLNDAYFDILGFTREEFQSAQERGVGWGEQILEEDQHITTESWLNLAQRGEPLNIEFRVKKPWSTYDSASGTVITGPTWLQGTAFAEKDAEGNVLAVQGFVFDISLKKFSERLLSERLEEALNSKRQADRFIDMTSHEMRNPLSAILQSADGILTAIGCDHATRSLSLDHSVPIISDDTVETVVDAAQTIILCASHQKRIVDDILTLSKLDSNLLTIAPDKSHLPTLIEKSFKMFEAELERAEIDFALEIEDGYHNLDVCNIMLDSSRVLQVIINLLTNAIKFTQHAESRKITIFLNASKTRPDGSNHNACFIEQRPNRPDATCSPEWGTGEELYLLIAVQDSGRGLNEEELKLLFHRFSQASPKTYKQYGGSGLGLFISRELTELQGGQIGVESEAGRGSTFTFYIKARHALGDDEMVLTDDVPGYHSSPSLVPRARSRDGPLANGAPVQHLALPPRNTAIQRRPSLLLKRPPPLPKVVSNPQSLLHVLVVEDNEINQRVMANQLRRLGCTVYIAQHGLEALDFLERTSAWNPTDANRKLPTGMEPVHLSVVLMDLEMPVLGGLDSVKRIRQLQSEGKLLKHVPVIAVTANARSEQIAVAKQHGMDLVVTKPFRIPELVPQMEALVARLGT